MRREPVIGKSQRKLLMMTVLSLSLIPVTAHAEIVSAGAGWGATVVSDVKKVQAPIETSPAPQAKITKEQAVATVKALFPQLKDAETSRVELGDNHRFPAPYQNVWDISWQITRGKGSYGFGSQVDSMTGELLETSLPMPMPMEEDNQAYYPPKVNEDEALTLAKAFIIKASKGLSENDLQYTEQPHYKESSLFGPVQYSFNFSTLVNGLPSPSENISVVVNGKGEITSYHRGRTSTTYPSPTAAVTPDLAAGQYQLALNLGLQYIPVMDPYSRNKSWFLGWGPFFQGDLSIDAQTGDFVNFSGKIVKPDSIQYKDVVKTDKVFAAVKGQGDDGLLTEEQAAAVVEAFMPELKGRAPSYSNLNYYWNDKNQRVWNLNWEEMTPSGPSGGQLSSATVDASTGQVLEMRENRMMPPQLQAEPKVEEKPGPALSEQAAEEKAMALVNELYPQAAAELKWVTPDLMDASADDSHQFQFRFQRFLNGIPVNGDYTHIILGQDGGLIVYNSSRSAQLEAESAGLEAKTTKEQAEAAYKEQTGLELQYKQLGGFSTENGYVEPNMKLVYSFVFKDKKMTGYVLDAGTGKWRALMTTINPASDSTEGLPSDVQGHRAQKELETLVRYGILQPDADGKLRPDDTITVGDWIKLVANATGPRYFGGNGDALKPLFQDVPADSPYFEAVQMFVGRQWLDPSATVKLGVAERLTREKLADLLVGMLKYDKLAAQLNTGEESDFADQADIQERGAVRIASQLGLFGETGDRFNPKGTVTKAEAAEILMRIVYLQGKLDQPLVN